jgi:tetratricopeptide (TPR) repeat protein
MPKRIRLGRFAPWLLAAGLFAAVASGQEPTPPAAPSYPMVNRPVTSPGNAEWAPDVPFARKRAAAQKKLVYYDIGDDGCGDCRRMQALLYPAFDFEALLIGMVPVQVKLSSTEGKAIGERYGITETPAVLITTPEGRLVFQMQGFKDAPDFYRHAHQDIDAYRKFALVVDAEDVKNLSAEQAYSSGRALYARFDYEAAALRLQRAAEAPGVKLELRESALMGLAAAERQLGHMDAARGAARKVVATTKNADQKERAELFLAELDLNEDRLADALAAYRKFAKDHPKSPYLEKVQGFIAKLAAAEPKP